MSTITKTFEELQPGDIIIVPGDPQCNWLQFREDQEFTVEKKHDDKTIKVKEMGGIVVRMNEYNVKTNL